MKPEAGSRKPEARAPCPQLAGAPRSLPRLAGNAPPCRRRLRRRLDAGLPPQLTWIVRCACGLELRNHDEARLIDDVQRHAREAHDLDLNPEQVRAMMELDQ